MRSSKAGTNALRMRMSFLSGGLSSAQKAVEKDVLDRCLEYLEAQPTEDIVDINVALWCLRAKSIFDHHATGKHGGVMGLGDGRCRH